MNTRRSGDDDFDVDIDDFDSYEARFDPMNSDRKARRKRKVKAHHTPKKPVAALLGEVADINELENSFKTTYKPAKYEAEWLLQSLRTFYDRKLISDVVSLVKGGKEASVYVCESTPATGAARLAAKVYRPRMFRQLRNDSTYREGRAILKEDGSVIKKTDHRIMRALGKKSAYGEQVAHSSWLTYEFNMLTDLHQAGGDVPRPVAAGQNAILMAYVGEDGNPAPTLNQVRLERREAAALFDAVLRNVELMLSFGWIHGDLSAYNILYWEGDITLIDFPQVTDSQANHQARMILQRDIRRVCEYFNAQGIERDADGITGALWARYVKQDAVTRAAEDILLTQEDEDEDIYDDDDFS